MIIKIHPVVACLLTYLSFAGWGSVIWRLLRLKAQFEIGMLTALGLAATAIAGGFLSLGGVSEPILLRLYLVAGISALIYFLVFDRKIFASPEFIFLKGLVKNRLALVLAILAVVLIVLSIAASPNKPFNVHDDYHAYLVFPCKIIQTGGLGADPFSERRMVALGGQSFLQALLLGLTNLKYINVLEGGLGWLIFICLVAGHCIRRNLPPVFWLSLVILLHFVKLPLANASSTLTSAALFLALMRSFFVNTKESLPTRILLSGLIVAGLCSLKSSNLIGAAILLLAFYLFGASRAKLPRLVDLLLVAVSIGIFLSPWMLDSYLSSGTLLYPIFGQGYHGSSYGPFPPVSTGEFAWGWFYDAFKFILLNKSFVFGLVMIFFIVRYNHLEPLSQKLPIIIFAGAWVSAAIIALTSGINRYGFPVTISCLILLMIECFAAAPANQRPLAWHHHRFAKIAVLIIFFFVFCWPKGIGQFRARAARLSHPPPRWTEKDVECYANLQKAIPPGVSILVRASKPFLLDLNRNKVFIIDWPGGASPPPGLPLEDGPEQLADYLRSQSIQYVLYTYGDEAGYSYAKYKHRLKWHYGYFSRVRKLSQYTFLFQTRLLEMAHGYQKIYDDGQVFVLDLGIYKSQ